MKRIGSRNRVTGSFLVLVTTLLPGIVGCGSGVMDEAAARGTPDLSECAFVPGIYIGTDDCTVEVFDSGVLVESRPFIRSDLFIVGADGSTGGIDEEEVFEFGGAVFTTTLDAVACVGGVLAFESTLEGEILDAECLGIQDGTLNQAGAGPIETFELLSVSCTGGVTVRRTCTGSFER